MLDFESDIENLKGKYLVMERHILQIQDILLQYSQLDYQIFPLQIIRPFTSRTLIIHLLLQSKTKLLYTYL